MNRVTKESIEAKIKDVQFSRLTEKLTHCIITLKNGFQVTGESACVDPKNYNREIGERIAKENAFEKIWLIEGYLLQEKLHIKKGFEERNPKTYITPDEALISHVVGGEIDKKIHEKMLFGDHKSDEVLIETKKGNYRLNLRFSREHRELFKEIFQEYDHLFSQDKVREYPLSPEQAFSKSFSNEEKQAMDETYANQEAKAGLIPSSSVNSISLSIQMMDDFHLEKLCQSLFQRNRKMAERFFNAMFPNSAQGTFDICDGRVLREEKPFDWAYWTAMLEDPKFKEIAFYKMFPGATKAAFDKLESFRKVSDESSFMEKLENILISEMGKTRYEGDGTENDLHKRFNKLVRQEVDVIIQAIKGQDRKSLERSTAIRKLTEGVMWMGMDLKAMGADNPYPESKNPDNAKVEPTADGMKL